MFSLTVNAEVVEMEEEEEEGSPSSLYEDIDIKGFSPGDWIAVIYDDVWYPGQIKGDQ